MNNQLMETLMQQMATDNPKLLAVMEMMKQQQQQQESTEHTSESVSVSPKLLQKEIYKRKKLVKQFKELEHHLEGLENILDDLAASLGACTFCWGTDSGCNMCEGKGTPGAFKPDKKLFQYYVLPVLKNTPWIRQMFIQELNN